MAWGVLSCTIAGVQAVCALMAQGPRNAFLAIVKVGFMKELRFKVAQNSGKWSLAEREEGLVACHRPQ